MAEEWDVDLAELLHEFAWEWAKTGDAKHFELAITYVERAYERGQQSYVYQRERDGGDQHHNPR
jgi:hypothetical protein